MTNGKKSATLVELLVAAVIVSLVLAAILATFLTVKAYIYRANKRTVATNLSRSNSYSLGKSVSANWDDSTHPLSTGTESIDSYSIDGIDYGPNNEYTVEDEPAFDYRKISITINYPE